MYLIDVSIVLVYFAVVIGLGFYYARRAARDADAYFLGSIIAAVVALGLFRHLLPLFQKETGIEVRVVAVGTGQAIRLARRGDADVLFVHHRPSEEKFVADGHGVRRNLSSRPVDFTDPLWLERTPARRIFFVIREGVRGTAMAGWRTLDETETWDLVAYVMSVAEPKPHTPTP